MVLKFIFSCGIGVTTTITCRLWCWWLFCFLFILLNLLRRVLWPRMGLSWWILYVSMRKMWILLLDEVACRCPLSPVDWWSCWVIYGLTDFCLLDLTDFCVFLSDKRWCRGSNYDPGFILYSVNMENSIQHFLILILHFWNKPNFTVMYYH